ncbi:hypothetical protein PSAN_56020 [Pseudomonas antarctica]|uniref:Uncharacterized protein n=1 Tax=Pseudomonas antarctica TaxID=219572 RepID=A0ABQ6ZMS9_9PSED|nr:hypothetical protein PSAN_56020 [Pseudomonas antarctica]
MWGWLACDGINWLCLIHRGACIAGKPAPTEKQSAMVLAAKLGQNCGSGLAREGGVSVINKLTDPPPSRASPLPQLDLGTSDRECAAVLLPCFCFYHSGRLLGRRALAFDLDLDLRRPVKPRWPNAGLNPWVNRQDAGLAAMGQGWPMAAAHGFKPEGTPKRERGAEWSYNFV